MPLARGGDSVLAEARRPTGLRVTGRARPACPGRAGSVAVGSPAEPEGTAGGRGCSVGAGLRAGLATACLSPRAGGDEQRCGSPVGARAVAGAGRSFVFPVCRGPGSDNLLPRPCPWPSGLGAQDMCRSHVLRPQTLGPLGGREARPPAASGGLPWSPKPSPRTCSAVPCRGLGCPSPCLAWCRRVSCHSLCGRLWPRGPLEPASVPFGLPATLGLLGHGAGLPGLQPPRHTGASGLGEAPGQRLPGEARAGRGRIGLDFGGGVRRRAGQESQACCWGVCVPDAN